MTNYRIMAAEFVGLTCDDEPLGAIWWNPKKGRYIKLPDPEHNDSDCMALVRALRKARYRVRIDIRDNGKEFVEIWRAGSTNWKFGAHYDAACGDDYKQGVKELAEPILREWYERR